MRGLLIGIGIALAIWLAAIIDDAIVAALALRHLLRSTSQEVLSGHWQADPATLRTIVRG